MIIMSKKAVKRYLEDLLVELEVNPTKEAQVKFVNTINRYHIYNLQKYVEKEFQIPKIPYNKKEGK